MSTGQIKSKTNQSDGTQNTRARSNKVTNNTNKQEMTDPIINYNNIQTNPSKISLRNHNGKKQSSNNFIYHDKDQEINDETAKSQTVLSKDDTVSNCSNSHQGEVLGGRDNNKEKKLRGQGRQQFIDKGISIKNELKGGNKIQFFAKYNNNNSNNNNNGIFESMDSHQFLINKNKVSSGNGNVRNEGVLHNQVYTRNSHTYGHNHVNSAYNINSMNNNNKFEQITSNCQEFRKDSNHPIEIVSKKQQCPEIETGNPHSGYNNNKNNKPQRYQAQEQQFNNSQHYDDHTTNTQTSNLKSFNSTSFTREEFNGSQSAKHSNSSSFYDNNNLSLNIPTPINSFHSLKTYNNDSANSTPTNFQLKNSQNTQFFNYFSTEQIGQNNRLATQPAKSHFQLKNYLYEHHQNPNFHQNFTKHPVQKEPTVIAYKQSFPTNLSSKPNNQPNSQSNLIIRNHQCGTTLQPVQRTKSHSKQYSNNDLVGNRNTQMTQTAPNYNRINFGIQTQPHYMSKQLQIIKCQPNQNQSYLNTINFKQHQQQHEQPFKSTNNYVNMVSNFNRSREKEFQLDEIAERDELGKVFVRVNQNQRNSQMQQEANYSSKYIQRQQQQQEAPGRTVKQKINVVSDGCKPQYRSGPVQYSQTNQRPSFMNPKYIKSPTNNEMDNKAQYIQIEPQRTRNQNKYLKINYQPLLRTQTNSQHSFKQSDKMQTQSVNASFKKDNNSQTRSVHEYKRAKNENKKSPILYEYEKKETSIKDRPQYEGYSSKSNLHEYNNNDTLPNYQRTSFFDQLTPTKNSEHQNESYLLGALNNNNQYAEQYHQHIQGFSQQQGGFNSSGSKQFVRSGNQHACIYTAENQSSGQKINIFGSKQNDFRPIQKSHFLQQEDTQKYRENLRQKKSIKKMLVSQSKGLYNKPQILVSLNFKDLLKGEQKQERPNSRTLIQAITKNHFTKVFCTTFKIGENDNGCDCVPKCYWVDQWLQIINNSKILKEKSMMKNIDMNKLLNFSSDNIWKNKVGEQVVSFGDVNKTSNLSNEQINTFKQIEKDIPRTFSSHPTFKNQKFRDFLREVLIHSYYLDPKLGYVQGMNIITASIIYHSKTTEQALQLVDFVMHVLDYKKIYMNDMKKCRDLAAKTCQIIRVNCYDMYNHVVIDNEVDLEMFIVGWYFSMLGTFVPLEAMHFVINKFIQKQFAGIMKIIVTFFIFIKDILMQKNDPNQIMQELSVQSMIDRSAKIDWNELISVSDKLKLTLDKQDL